MKKEDFDSLSARLRYWHRGEGVNDHCTADPIFEVQEKRRVYGIDADYTDNMVVVDSSVGDGGEWENPMAFFDSLDEEDRGDVLAMAKNDDSGRDFAEMDEDEQLNVLKDCGFDDLAVVGYTDEWRYVNTHLTKEGAEAFIRRKKHDYGELRVYVDSLYWCAEFKELINALLDGEIVYKGEA